MKKRGVIRGKTKTRSKSGRVQKSTRTKSRRVQKNTRSTKNYITKKQKRLIASESFRAKPKLKNRKSFQVINEKTELTEIVTQITKLIRKNDTIDLGDITNRDIGQLYLVYLPYFHSLLKKIKYKKYNNYRVFLEYFDLIGYDGISSSRRETIDLPKDLDDSVYGLLEVLLKQIEKYLRVSPTIIITRVGMAFYKTKPKKKKGKKRGSISKRTNRQKKKRL